MKSPFYYPYQFLFPLVCGLLCACQTGKRQALASDITRSEIRLTDDGYRIFLNGEPVYIKGAGVDNGDLGALAAHGANVVRTWSSENGKYVLDQAHELGLKVMMGLWVMPERHGFDYDDEAAVKKQNERIRETVMAYKDHPALVAWLIGNELNHEYTNPRVWEAVNDISKMIHELDPYHLTTTPLAGLDKPEVDWLKSKAPDLDFISAQLYGPIDQLPELIEATNYQGPLMVTEWGATGYWEVPETEWGAPIENNSSIKADLYLSRYQNAILSQSQQVMGSFVFLWGQKQERTPTWFGMFMPEGNETESVDVMHYAWNGQWPENRSPKLLDFTLDGNTALDNVRLKSGESYQSSVSINDPDGDPLVYQWEIRQESRSTKSGGDKEYIPEVIEGLFSEGSGDIARFSAPKESGAYRLFIYVEDGKGHTAHANIPFWVGP
ncbi:MAG: glycoside hydrolase family 2 TIM barrel-domain containing protein [Cytophagales bacterium]|nr:glycoside hydrolase family 2 TIM barrel-domain containing protein [Cytophagales bacterium]